MSNIIKLYWMYCYIPGIHFEYFVLQNIPQISQQFKPNNPLDNNVYTIQWTSAPVIGLCVSTNSSQLHNWWQQTGCHTCYMLQLQLQYYTHNHNHYHHHHVLLYSIKIWQKLIKKES